MACGANYGYSWCVSVGWLMHEVVGIVGMIEVGGLGALV